MGKFVKHGMSAHEIYQYFADGRGTDTLDIAQNATRIEWNRELERAKLIHKQGDLIRGGWQGTASDGAFGAAKPLADHAEQGADLLSRAEDLLDRQSGSYHRAANSVTPVPEEPPAIDLSDPMVVFTDYEAQIKDYQSQTHHNLDVYGVYDGASEYNQTNMPGEYSTINHAGGSNITVTDGKPAEAGDYIEVPEREQPHNGGETGPYGGPSGPGLGGSPVNGPPPVSGPIPNPSQPQQTTPSTYVPPTINTPGQFPSPGQNPYQPTPGANPPGYVSGLPVSAGPGASPGGARGGGYGPRGGGPGGGYGGGQGGNPGGAGPRGAMPGPGGAAAGALAAEEAAARRAAAAAAAARGGAAGGMGGAPLGGGRGQGDEDEEHKRKVLIETDAESVFGSDVLTAPQVIGDDEYEDD